MAKPTFPDPKRPRRAATPKQIAAGARNWAAMLVTGALGQLRWIRANAWTPPESHADLDTAIDALARIDERRRSVAAANAIRTKRGWEPYPVPPGGP